MADFIIPQNEEFRFTVKVITDDSYLPQNVASLDTVNSSVKIQRLDDLSYITNTGITITKIPDTTGGSTYANGMIQVVIPATVTDSGNLKFCRNYDRGDKVDGYYLKPIYQILITLKFSDPEFPSRTAVIKDVYVQPANAIDCEL